MKRKKWSELEEQTLLTKYSDLHTSGTLAKFKTREKKFKPIADHVNSVHHFRDPINFPFKWSWRDVSIKVQNMRHQYLGVKQKIRVSEGEYNWKDGENHWENFLRYKEVFGDIELESKDHRRFGDEGVDLFGDSNGGEEFFGLGFDELQTNDDDGEEEEEDEDDDDEDERGEKDELGLKRSKRGFGGKMLGLVGAQMMELKDVVMRREEKRREREERRVEREFVAEKRRKEAAEEREKRELESRVWLEEELAAERRRRLEVEEKWEEEEMKWREKMVSMQMEHEKQMMQLQASACQNQMQVLGAMARVVCQFFGGSTGDALTPQVLQHPGDENGKPDVNSPSQFL